MIQANINNRWAQLSQGEKAELLGIYTRAGYNDLAGIIAHYNSCGGKLKADGGPVVNTAQYKRDTYLYNPPVNVEAPIETPLRYKPLPDYGDYEPQKTTGMLEDIPIEIGLEAPQRGYGILIPDISSTTPTLDARQDAARRIMAVENSKNNVNGGYDAKTGRWYPHKSHEGGADTIAYGIKLSNGTPEAALALKQGYLTDEQAVSAVDSLVQKYYDAAKKVYDGKYGAGEWDKLSDKSQSILVDYSYNPGLAKFPKLMEGFHSGNLDLIRKNYKRYVNGKELGRNKVLLEELDTLGNEYPIFRAEGGRLYRDGGDDDGIYLGELQPAIVKPNPVAVRLYTDPITKRTPITHSSLEMSEIGLKGAGHSFFVSKGSSDPTYSLLSRNCSDATGEILEVISGQDFTSGITTPFGVRRKAREVFGNYPGYFEGVGPDYGADSPRSTVQYFEIPWYDYRIARDVATERRAESLDKAARKAGIPDEKREEIIQYIYNDTPLLPYRLNEEASGGPINRFEMGGPGSIVNPKIVGNTVKRIGLNLLPKNVSKGLASIVSMTYGDLRTPYLKDYYQYGVKEDWNPEEGFLMSPSNQRKYMESIGYHKVDDDSYGMVNKAATNLSKMLGSKVPIYQLGDNDISPDEVELVSTNQEEVSPYFDLVLHGAPNRLLRDPGSHPSALYKDKAGNYYIKSWDLNDYGQHGKKTNGTTYGVKQLLAEMYDFIGTPFVQRTGLIRVPKEEELPTYDKSMSKTTEDIAEYYRKAIQNGEFASGGRIHIKPENRGKFTALKKRTGHSASWFKAHGTPAQKKMATFALNARKWKHEDGGPLQQYADFSGFF